MRGDVEGGEDGVGVRDQLRQAAAEEREHQRTAFRAVAFSDRPAPLRTLRVAFRARRTFGGRDSTADLVSFLGVVALGQTHQARALP